MPLSEQAQPLTNIGADPADFVSYTFASTLAVDGSTTAKVYRALPGPEEVWLVHRCIMYIEDATAFSDGEFGGLGSALTNGVLLEMNGERIINAKTNGDFLNVSYDAETRQGFSNAGNNLAMRWTFSKATGNKGLIVERPLGAAVTIRDDLTGLTAFRITLQGVKKRFGSL